MNQYTLFVLISPFACAITVAIAFYCWRFRSTPTALPLAVTTAAISAYIFCNTLELVNPTPKGTLFFAQLCYVCIGVLTISWMAFSLTFSNHALQIKTPLFSLLAIIPVLTIIAVFTDPNHHLIWKDYTFVPVANGFLFMHVMSYGPLFWVFWIQAYLLILLSAILTIWTCFSQRHRYRERALLITFAMLLPLSANLVYVLHLIPGLNKDYSCIAYSLGAVLLAAGIFHYQLIDLTPFARGVLIDKMADAVLTLDTSRRLIDFNPAAQRVFSKTSRPAQKFTLLPQLTPYLDSLDKQEKSREILQTEMNLDQMGEECFYDLQIRRLRNGQDIQKEGEMVGYLVQMHSITEHKKLLDEMQKLAEQDSLTGISNRSHFIDIAHHELEICKVNSHFFSILMIDIDYFKRINDSIGHLGGDQILQAFAQRLKDSLRGRDVLGRIGGDEFIVLLPETSAKSALVLGERLCQEMSKSPFKTQNNEEFPISISIGVAQYADNGSETLEKIIAQADLALYQAKGLGRNRTCIYNPNFSSHC